jgi:hypothetical protein
VPGWRSIFPGFSGFFASTFFEKWSYLPTPPGKDCRGAENFAGLARGWEISAGTNFPRPRKIDV